METRNLKMNVSLSTDRGPMKKGKTYAIESKQAAKWIARGWADDSKDLTEDQRSLIGRLEDGAGRPCLFLPFCGEFGHEIMSHSRMVHFHKASEKIVCCRPGHEVLYPSATRFITDWKDPIDDASRAGTIRKRRLLWPELVARFPDHYPVAAGGLTPEQELVIIGEGQPVPYNPVRRGLKVDVLFGIRRREFAPEKNWSHWQKLADAAKRCGLTYAVIGARETSHDVDGQVLHTGDMDTAAAIELMQACKLYVGTDSGNSHLASTVGCPMLVFREPRNGMRDFLPRMERMNPGKVDVIPDGWDNPDKVIARMICNAVEFEVGTSVKPPPGPQTSVPPPAALFTAQHGEDRWMGEHWAELKLPKKGTYVEVGAGDGVRLSNTHWLAKTHGWRGLLVEPDPRSVEKLRTNRPESKVAAVAAGAEAGTATIQLTEEPLLSGLLREEGTPHQVKVETLTALLEAHKYKRIDVLSIDTEGTELDVWQGFDFKRWRPRLVIMEWDTVGMPSNRVAIIDRLGRDGFKLAAQLGGNLLFTPDGGE